MQDKNRLICEDQLQPVFELRWFRQTDKDLDYQRQCERVGYQVKFIPLPPGLESLAQRYQIRAFKKKESPQLAGFFAYCPHCQTGITIQLYKHNLSSQEDILEILMSMDCHGDARVWEIQDFRFALPGKKDSLWQLERYSFAPALTHLQFTRGPLGLHICRIAASEERLAEQGIDEILEVLCDRKGLQVEEGEGGLRGWHAPSIFQQITLRSQRKKPFIESRIRHLPEKNRILVCMLESKKPIEVSLVQQIWQSYDIVL
ncbi:hypothetical protein [Desulfotalea psychrophila]|uniref:hypothetical protein n=1 Tax=Desulfotalea psychrophila TaxID=84980 RepID=UPI0012EB0519|nr:hypothetical protein [Desulfotalea psychrophila]